jgi:hypothetical protein
MLTEQAIAAHLERVRTDGFTIVEDAIEPDLVSGLLEDLTRLETELAVTPAKNIFEGLKTIRIYNLLARGSIYARIPVHENVLLPKPRPAIICNTMWALTDFTAENGATRIMPGTHKADRSPEYGPVYETIPAVMKRGSVLVWDGSLWHGGGANQTDERRVGIAMNYCAGYLRQQENQQLGIPFDVLRGFSPRLRKLVGYGIYKGLIGHIDKCSPTDILDGTGPRRVVGEM